MSLSDLAPELDLANALLAASRRRNLLPPRPDQGVGGEVGQRFHEALRHRLLAETYSPSRAYVVPVPKPGYTTRPASVMTLEDRTVYEALVSRLSQRIEQQLLTREVVYAHRAVEPRRPYREFEEAPLHDARPYVVVADVFGYYEGILHDMLVDRLITVTGDRIGSQAIGTFLTQLLGAPRGLPQGTRASDALATVYFDPVDRAMLRHGYRYVRYGDDVRMTADSFSNAREAIARLESSVRGLGLALNGSKTRVFRLETYQRNVSDANAAREELKERMHRARIDALAAQVEEAETLDELEGVLSDDMLWGLYSGDVTVADILAEMSPLLEPTIQQVAEGLFTDTLARAPWSDQPLRREAFHGRFVRSLKLMTETKSVVGLADAERLLYRLPDETEEVAHYLRALAEVVPERVQAIVRASLLGGGFRHEWQEAWLYAVLGLCPSLPDDLARHALRVAADEDRGWLARASALVLLARFARADRHLAARMWELAPAPFRSEIIAAAAWQAADGDWERFLNGCKGDPVHEVVVAHVRQAQGV